MKKQAGKARKPKARKNIILRMCIFVFVAYAAIQLVDMQMALGSRRQELEELKVRYEQQRLDNKELERRLARGVDEEYIESAARDKLDFVAPDERVYIDISGS